MATPSPTSRSSPNRRSRSRAAASSSTGGPRGPEPMLTGIDHVVVTVRSVEAAAETLERELGIAFSGGGRHDAWGTYNRLAFFGDTYLELIGVFDADVARSADGNAVSRAALDALEGGDEGLVTYAVATAAIARDVAGLRDAGTSIGLPVAGSRTRRTARWS